MLCRSKRGELTSSSNVPVGPGSYDPQLPHFKPKCGAAPFGSTTERHTVDMPHFATPGPGSYSAITGDVKRLDVRPSPQFLSKAPRIAAERQHMKGIETPGPGSYTAELVRERPMRNQTQAHAADDRSGLAWVKIATVPSIPAPGQSFGYEEGKAGELVQQAAPFKGHSGDGRDLPGPGEYEPKLPPKGPKGTSFAKSAAGRLAVVSRDALSNPGPGSYALESTLPREHWNRGAVSKRPMSMFASTTARSSLSGSGGGPGPGQYKPKSSFVSLREHLAANPESYHAFGSSSQQLHMKVDAQGLPGPGSYNPTLPPQNAAFAKASSAFVSTAPRFSDTGRVSSETPGPGVYEVAEYTLARELGKKFRGKFGAFGSCSTRFDKRNERSEQQSTPSPVSYSVKESNPADLRRKDKRTPAFRSSSVRQDLTPAANGTPTFYDTKIDWPKPTTSSKAFIAAAARFKNTAAAQSVPGPGHYDQKVQPPHVDVAPHKPSFGTSARFTQSQAQQAPGPGSYNTTPSMIRSTFNITIGEGLY